MALIKAHLRERGGGGGGLTPIAQYTIINGVYIILQMTCHVFPLSRNLEGLCRTAYLHLQRVAKERDNHYDTLLEVILERDYYKHLHETQNPNNGSLVHENGLNVSRSSSTPVKSPSVNPELIELKKKCRHLQEQLLVYNVTCICVCPVQMCIYCLPMTNIFLQILYQR